MSAERVRVGAMWAQRGNDKEEEMSEGSRNSNVMGDQRDMAITKFLKPFVDEIIKSSMKACLELLSEHASKNKVFGKVYRDSGSALFEGAILEALLKTVNIRYEKVAKEIGLRRMYNGRRKGF